MNLQTLYLLFIFLVCSVYGQVEIESWTNLPVQNNCTSISFSPDSQLLAYGTDVGDLTVVQLETGEDLLQTRTHDGKVTAIIFSSDNSTVYSAGQDDCIYATNTNTKEKKLLGKHPQAIAMSISPDGKYLVSNSLSGAKVWKTKNYTAFREFSLSILRHTAYSKDAKLLALGNKNDIVLKKMPGGMPFRKIKGHSNILNKMSFSSDSQWLVSVGWDKKTYVWDVNSGSKITAIDNKSNAKFAEISPQKTVVLLADINEIAFFNIKNKTYQTLQQYHHCINFVVSSDWKFLAGFSSNAVKLWTINIDEGNANSKTLTKRKGLQLKLAKYSPNITEIKKDFAQRYQNYENKSLLPIVNFPRQSNSPIFCMRYNNSEEMFAAGNYDGKIYVWSLKSKRLIASLPGHQTKTREVCFSADSKYLISGGEDNTIKIWDIKSQKEVGSIDVPAAVTSFDVSHEGAHVITSNGTNLKVYNLATGEFSHTFRENGSINKLRFSYKENIAACLTAAGSISIYDVSTGSKQRFIKESKRIRDFEFSLDGNKLIVAYDNQVDILEVNNWRKTHQFSIGQKIKQVAISPDNNVITVFDSVQRKMLFFSVTLQKQLQIEAPISAFVRVAISPKYQYFTHIQNQTLDVYSLQDKQEAPVAVKIYEEKTTKNTQENRYENRYENTQRRASTRPAKDVSFPKPNLKNKLSDAVVIMPLTMNKKSSYLGAYLSLMGMYHATYVPEQITAMSVTKIDELFDKYNVTFSQKLAEDQYTQQILLNYFQTKNLVTGDIKIKGTDHYVSLHFEGNNGNKTFQKKFGKRELTHLPLWIGSCVHQYLRIKLSAKQQSYFKKNPYRHFVDIVKAAKIYRTQSLNSNHFQKDWQTLLKKNPQAIFFLHNYCMEKSDDDARKLITKYYKKYPTHDLVKDLLLGSYEKNGEYENVENLAVPLLKNRYSQVIAYHRLYYTFKALNRWEEIPQLIEYFQQYNKNDYWFHQLMGNFYIDYAWHARGAGLAKSVSQEQFASFEERLKKAEAHLRSAYKINPNEPRTPTSMLIVCKGLGHSKVEMEKWFGRATEKAPYYFDAYNLKRDYLHPKWYGSIVELLNFSDEIVENCPPFSKTRFITASIYQELLHRKIDRKIWPKIRDLYEPFLHYHPESYARRSEYIGYAIQTNNLRTAIKHYVYAQKKKYDSYLEYYDVYYNTQKTNFYFALADYYLPKNKKYAIKFLKKGLEFNPRSWKHQMIYASFLAATKRYSAAAQHYQVVSRYDTDRGRRARAKHKLRTLKTSNNSLQTFPKLPGGKLYAIGMVEPFVFKHNFSPYEKAIEKIFGIEVEIIAKRLVSPKNCFCYDRHQQVLPWYQQLELNFGKSKMDELAEILEVPNNRSISSDEYIVKSLLQQTEEGSQAWKIIEENYNNYWIVDRVVQKVGKDYKPWLKQNNGLGLLIMTGDNIGTNQHQSMFAYGEKNLGVVSYYKSLEPEKKQENRVSKQMFYAVCKILGLPTCFLPTCPASYAGTLEDLDSQSDLLCEECIKNLRKTYKRIQNK